MLLPESISVGGISLKIIQDKLKAGEENHGRLNWDERNIGIAPGNRKDMWATLYHEVVHAATHVSGLFWLLGDDTEEAVVRMVEHILIPVIKELHLQEINRNE